MRERKPFDADVRRLLEEQAALAGPPQPMTTEARVQASRAFMLRVVAARTSIAGLPNAVETRELEVAPGLGARLYSPPGATKPLPILVYLHGGGWVFGSIATLDPFCRLLCEAASVLIASIEYRLSPEHRHPAAVEDTLAAARWAAAHASEAGGDPSRIALGGDSAGGNLAAVAANLLCANGEADWLRALLLLYPVTDHPSAGHPSYAENATGYGLEANVMSWFWEQYAPASPDDPTVSPLRLPRLPRLPPTLVATAEYDVLRDEGIAYADKLRAAGTAVTHLHSPDMGHNFSATPNLVGRFPQSRETFAELARWLRTALHEPM